MSKPCHSRNTPPRTLHAQNGAALMVMMIIMVLGSLAFLVGSLSKINATVERDKITSDSLAQAKESLIAFASTVQLDNNCTGTNCARPGDLPCPDTNNDGQSDACTGQNLRLGRLPWKTLGIAELRDSTGERLWYAVSNNFKNNPRTTCTNPLPGNNCLNSDTPGTISVFAADGTQLNNGGVIGTGAVAVVIAPGAGISRHDNVIQNRGCTVGVDCDVNDKCTTSPPTNTPKCNPANYLDVATLGTTTHDNQSFIDSSPTDGFIQGRIKDANGNTLLNDQLLVITQDNIMQVVQKRVAAEVKQCLVEYANNNNGHLPWAARIRTTSAPNYADRSDRLFGRIPKDLSDTLSDSGDNMTDMWGPTCNTHNNNTESGWWNNWKEMVFYGIADAYKPSDPPDNITPNTCTTGGTCLSVNPPSPTVDKQFVVIVAGRKLSTQNRYSSSTSTANIYKGTLSNYLEAPNPTVYFSPSNPPGEPKAFSLQSFSSSFNDTVVFQ